jgi:flagellar hook-associated protein FlgK
MSDILSIGASATQLYRASLSTVSNNIANLNTDGYTRQVSSSTESVPSRQGTVYIGTGARLENITRAYDEFAESTLRNSGSELAGQKPMIDYSNRIVDIMGAETSSLSGALDQFFGSANRLSTDPASISLRNIFLRDGEALASRFRELSGQLGDIEAETQTKIEMQVSTLNNISQQLAAVNGQLNKAMSADMQPAALLDQRDSLLRDLAQITKINVREFPSGAVDVRLGSNVGSVAVSGTLATAFGSKFHANEPGRIDIIADPNGESSAVSSATGGTLGGLIQLRSQVLAPAMDGFDKLAQAVAKEMNTIHTSGLDARGERGKDLFKIDPIFDVSSPAVTSTIKASLAVTDSDALKMAPFKMTWSAADKVWRIEDQGTNQVTFSPADAKKFTYSGLQISTTGKAMDGDTIYVEPSTRPAAGFRFLPTDPMAIAAAERLRAVSSESNIGLSKASIDYSDISLSADFSFGTSITSLGNNASAVIATAVTASNFKPAFVIPKGTDNVSLMMEVPEGSDLRFQVMTKEGVHVLGQGLTADEQNALLSTDPGFNQISSYSASYLNTTDTYRDLDMTYGHLARSSTTQNWVTDANGKVVQQTVAIDAQTNSAAVRSQTNGTGATTDIIAADALVLNGYSMGAMTLDAGVTSSAATMAAWVNGATASTGVTATAKTLIEAPKSQINLQQQLRVNGTLIGGGTPPASIDALATAINAQTATTKVEAYVDRDGGLVVTNAPGFEGNNITLANPDNTSTTNALGKANQAYSGTLEMTSSDKVEFTFGATGMPTDLATMGLRTGIYMSDAASEDLAVFVTGTGNAKVAAGFTQATTAAEQKTESPFSVTFNSDNQYNITDTATNTVVATREYAVNSTIRYNGLTLSFDSAPQGGDKFIIDGNAGGVGDNGNMLLIAGLQTKPVLSDGQSIGDGYIDIVSEVGSKATLSKVSQDALQVVYDQAVETKDQVSGVNLDEEAADLIRFQQAFQASAQLIQMSSKLFDSILGIR